MNFTEEDIKDLKLLLILLIEYIEHKNDKHFVMKKDLIEKAERILKIIDP